MQNNRQGYYRAVFKLRQPDDDHKFQPLPVPSGSYPFHLQHQWPDSGKLVFHMVGDTGGFRDTGFQHRVAAAMATQCINSQTEDERPQFLFHLGDIVYNYGEADGYAEQFFKPYENYPGQIYAIAGNHDSDVNPDAADPYQSLDAFTAVFCDTEHRKVLFGGKTKRSSGNQPNVYWTLETNLAIIIAMHSNVPKFGIVTQEQRNWLINELQTADLSRPGKAIIIAIHHAPYSADTNHGSSKTMIELLEGVFLETGIQPDMVVSGHVHNYQRFQHLYPEGKPLTYLVAGAGGYDELHSLAEEGNPIYSNHSPLLQHLQLQAYNDNKHGFLKIGIERKALGVNITGEYYLYTGEVADRFEIVVS
ncbi:metallophosphoesterase family protein [Mucilaginibacter psychrotolerans]|uniref:Metallophosphoesterase n=1 Tax=Mucilaginibacter psychrotolerans TaxID=1524096 RepID=A0A4Y8SDD1_9SPHI|nr:metallophosphoesterase [Mucilaginibacter psychrotolerans]TFF36366.1 metallophosphoesterase [Mucilaginibacter psychrotolerans]